MCLFTPPPLSIPPTHEGQDKKERWKPIRTAFPGTIIFINWVVINALENIIFNDVHWSNCLYWFLHINSVLRIRNL